MEVTLLSLLCPLLASGGRQGKQQINCVFKEQTGHCTGCCVADWIILQFEHQVTGRHLTLVKHFEKSDQSCHIVLLTILANARCQRGSSSVVEDDTKELLITLCGPFQESLTK